MWKGRSQLLTKFLLSKAKVKLTCSAVNSNCHPTNVIRPYFRIKPGMTVVNSRTSNPWQPRQDLLAEVGVMAGSWVLVGSVVHVGPNRIQVNVPHQFKEIAVAINQNCLEVALKKMSGAAFSPVDPASIAEGEVLQIA